MRIALVAGEASGDLLGAGLIRSLTDRVEDLHCEGIAGPAMQEAGCVALAEAEELAVMGLIEPLRHVPRLLRLRRKLRQRWIENPPDVFIGIDAPDFNLGLERKLREAGIPVVHYVSPSVWAWRQGRVHKIGRATDCVLCLLPFEVDFYARHGIAAEFVGHPLADNLPAAICPADARAKIGISSSRSVTIMPGSRRSEVTRLGPVFIAASRLLKARFPELSFVTPMANQATRRLFASQLQAAGMEQEFTVLDRRSADAILAGDVVLLASGTAALESALLCRATVAAYRLAPLTYWLARTLNLVKVQYFTLPNQLTEQPLLPEYLQDGATPEALADEIADLLENDDRRKSIEHAFAELRTELGRSASDRAAEAVIEVAR